MSEESAIWSTPRIFRIFGTGTQGVGCSKGEQGGGRSSDMGSC